jgi:hypothetical protein
MMMDVDGERPTEAGEGRACLQLLSIAAPRPRISAPSKKVATGALRSDIACVNKDVVPHITTESTLEHAQRVNDVMESFKSLQDEISKALVSTTRSATRIAGADIAFQRSLNPDVGAALDAQNGRLLALAQRLLENAAASSDAVGPKLPDVESIDGNWRAVVDVIDSLLEKADTSLDEYTGVVKRLSPSADPVRKLYARWIGRC